MASKAFDWVDDVVDAGALEFSGPSTKWGLGFIGFIGFIGFRV